MYGLFPKLFPFNRSSKFSYTWKGIFFKKGDCSFHVQQHEDMTFEIPCRILPESCKSNKKMSSAWCSSHFTNTSENRISFSHGHTFSSLQRASCEDCSQSKMSKLIIWQVLISYLKRRIPKYQLKVCLSVGVCLNPKGQKQNQKLNVRENSFFLFSNYNTL